MLLINLHRNLHEKSSFLSEIMFVRINPYLHHFLTRYQSVLSIIYESCVRKKGVPEGDSLLSVLSFRSYFPETSIRSVLLYVLPKMVCRYFSTLSFPMVIVEAPVASLYWPSVVV